MDNYSEGLATGMALQQGNGYVNGYNYGGFGGNGSWGELIGLIVVAGLFGFGNWGGNNGRGGNCATQADLAAGFNNSAVLSSLNDIKLGQAQAINYNNQGFSGLSQVINSGFSGIDNAICTLGYNQASLVNGLSRELADCCCKTQGAIADLKYSDERNTCSIIAAINAGNQRLVDIYTNDKIDTLNRKLSLAENSLARRDDREILLRAINRDRCPEPAYIVPNPNCCYNYNVQGVGYGSPCSCSAL